MKPHRLTATLLGYITYLQDTPSVAPGETLARRAYRVRGDLRESGALRSQIPNDDLLHLVAGRISDAWVHLYWIGEHLPEERAVRHLADAVDLMQQAIAILEFAGVEATEMELADALGNESVVLSVATA